jgi:hypothetical protein
MSVPTDVVCRYTELFRKSLNAFNMAPVQTCTMWTHWIIRMHTFGMCGAHMTSTPGVEGSAWGCPTSCVIPRQLNHSG